MFDCLHKYEQCILIIGFFFDVKTDLSFCYGALFRLLILKFICYKDTCYVICYIDGWDTP